MLGARVLVLHFGMSSLDVQMMSRGVQGCSDGVQGCPDSVQGVQMVSRVSLCQTKYQYILSHVARYNFFFHHN